MNRLAVFAAVVVCLSAPCRPAAAGGCLRGQNEGFEFMTGTGFGAIAAVGTSLVVPIVGAMVDGRENSPVGRAIGRSFLASFGGVALAFGIAAVACGGTSMHVEAYVLGAPLLAIAFGTTATILVYSAPKKRRGRAAGVVLNLLEHVAVVPIREASGNSGMLGFWRAAF